MPILRKLTMAGCALAAALSATVQAEELSHYTGAQLYERFCASCHGERGEGDGPVAAYFKIAPPDLTRIAKRRDGEFPAEEIRRIIDGRGTRGPHGTRTMPVWGMELQLAETGNPDKQKPVEELIERLVGYLRSIQK